jgi:hypothetical protein
MPGRFPGGQPNIAGKLWTHELSRHVEQLFRRSWGALAILGKAPRTPTTVEAGVTASVGSPEQTAASALDNHQHDIATGAPTVPIRLGTAASEGTGGNIMRAGAQFDTTLLEDDIDAKIAGARAFAFFLLES